MPRGQTSDHRPGLGKLSEAMNCDSVTSSIYVNSSTEAGKTPSIDTDSVSCKAAITGVVHGYAVNTIVHASQVSLPYPGTRDESRPVASGLVECSGFTTEMRMNRFRSRFTSPKP
jgi:hypothetical protein